MLDSASALCHCALVANNERDLPMPHMRTIVIAPAPPVRGNAQYMTFNTATPDNILALSASELTKVFKLAMWQLRTLEQSAKARGLHNSLGNVYGPLAKKVRKLMRPLG